MTLKGDAKFKDKLTRGLKNDIRNLVNFQTSSWKCGNLLWWLVLSKANKDLDKKLQRSYVSCNWKVMQKFWLLVPKMTWGIWWILIRTVAILKICSLMDCFCREYAMFKLKNYRGVVSWKMLFGEFLHKWLKVMLEKCSVYVLFWIKVAHQISTFWKFHCFSEVVQIYHVIFETRSQLLCKLCTIL